MPSRDTLTAVFPVLSRDLLVVVNPYGFSMLSRDALAVRPVLCMHLSTLFSLQTRGASGCQSVFHTGILFFPGYGASCDFSLAMHDIRCESTGWCGTGEAFDLHLTCHIASHPRIVTEPASLFRPGHCLTAHTHCTKLHLTRTMSCFHFTLCSCESAHVLRTLRMSHAPAPTSITSVYVCSLMFAHMSSIPYYTRTKTYIHACESVHTTVTHMHIYTLRALSSVCFICRTCGLALQDNRVSPPFRCLSCDTLMSLTPCVYMSVLECVLLTASLEGRLGCASADGYMRAISESLRPVLTTWGSFRWLWYWDS